VGEEKSLRKLPRCSSDGPASSNPLDIWRHQARQKKPLSILELLQRAGDDADAWDGHSDLQLSHDTKPPSLFPCTPPP